MYLYTVSLVYDAIFKEKEEEKHLLELEDRFLQRRKNSPDLRYFMLNITPFIIID